MAKKTSGKPKQAKTYFDSRASVPTQHRWKLEKMFSGLSAWNKSFENVSKQIKPLASFKGKLADSKKLLEFFQKSSAVLRQIEMLYVYASHLSAVDLSDHHAQIITQKAQNLYTTFSQTTSFQSPELSHQPESYLKKLLKDKNFHLYHRELKLILAKKKHILSDAEEAIMSQVGKLFPGPEDIFSALDNVDLTFGKIKDQEGKEVQITYGLYSKYSESPDRRVRRDNFENFYKSYQAHIHTYAQTLNLCVKQHDFYTKAKKYNSSLEAAISNNMIDPKVYRTLIDETHKSLKTLYKYFAFRAKKLKLKKLSMYDLRVNIFDQKPLHFSYDEAVDLCLEAVRPLGEEYVRIMSDGLRNGWVDKYENKGKRSGAFSGGCYDSDPYILMNFNGTLNDVYTLIHEGGHSMHSYLARKNQPYNLADYTLFTAEIASTVNERLLTRHLLKKFAHDPVKLKSVLAYEIDAIRATYFRQTMFAEFELLIHSHLEKGEPLTVQFFNEQYEKLNKLYHGPALAPDPYIQYEWARIPHFYYNFYVYVYATGIAAAYYFSDQILNPKTSVKATHDYLHLLKSGGNDFPLIQLKKVGLDFTKPDIYRAVAKNLQKCLNLL
ncbi:oligoendopeptidase F [Candidatus Peregrinibacteria bacterium]|nr:oligoendopeptidase F [Candidatus Peregrinibacteria bacterium]